MALRKRKYFQVKESRPDPLDALATLRKKQRTQEDHSLTKRDQHDYSQITTSTYNLVEILTDLQDQLPDSIMRLIAEYAPAATATVWEMAYLIYCRTQSELTIHAKMASQAMKTQAKVRKLTIQKNAELCELTTLVDIVNGRNSEVAFAQSLSCFASHWRHIQHLWSLWSNVRYLKIDCNKPISLHHVLLRCPNLRYLRLENLNGEHNLEYLINSKSLRTLILHFGHNNVKLMNLETPNLRILILKGNINPEIQVTGCTPSIVITPIILMHLIQHARCVILEKFDQLDKDDLLLGLRTGVEVIGLFNDSVMNSGETTELARQIFQRTTASTLIVPNDWGFEAMISVDDAKVRLENSSIYDPASFSSTQQTIQEACESPLPNLRRLLPFRKLDILRVFSARLIRALEDEGFSTSCPFVSRQDEIMQRKHLLTREIKIFTLADDKALELLRGSSEEGVARKNLNLSP